MRGPARAADSPQTRQGAASRALRAGIDESGTVRPSYNARPESR